MPKSPQEPVNLMLEQLRLLRERIVTLDAKMDAGFAKVDSEFKVVRQKISVIRRQTIGEVYKANTTFAGFADLEARLGAVERLIHR